jgi:hypothetical protein
MGVIDLVVLELDLLVGQLVHLFIFLFCSPDNLFDIEIKRWMAIQVSSRFWLF